MIHMHVTSWFIGIILFIVAVYLQKAGKAKAQKITQMVLRLFYLLILATGVHLVAAVWKFSALAIVKGLIGLWLIFVMEYILTRMKKGEATKVFWIQFVVALILVLVMGYGVL